METRMPGEVTLRPVTLADCTQRYVDWLNDPDVSRWLETRYEVQTLDKVKAFWKEQQKKDRAFLAICVDGQHIGNLKIGPVHPVHNFADISYFIGERAQWGKGYATSAVKQACLMAFKDKRVHRLQAGVYGRNEASKNVLRKAGFAYEGALCRQLKTEHGWDDHHWYGRLSNGSAL
jgi:RimJ/RimL family protein N-acetyltransferase